MLDELDRELECRGHRFVRYADDCNIYVRSDRAGRRVMESISRFISQKLKLKVNEAKSAVARPQERKFLGFSFTAGPDTKRTRRNLWSGLSGESGRSREGPKASASRRQWKNWSRICGVGVGFCETPEVLIALTGWVRRRLRAALWRQWKNTTSPSCSADRTASLGKLLNTAGSGRGPWNIARSKALSVGLSNACFKSLGLPALIEPR